MITIHDSEGNKLEIGDDWYIALPEQVLTDGVRKVPLPASLFSAPPNISQAQLLEIFEKTRSF